MKLLLLTTLAAGLALADHAAAAEFTGPKTQYHGYDRFDFRVGGAKALVVVPQHAAKGKPWIWRAMFFDHRPETDLALLAHGFHLAFIDVGNTFGCPDAMRQWDTFYELLTGQYGLSRKPALEGLSRGGLYVCNWAAAHPDSVACIDADNAVFDFKSWPGGKGKGKGSPADWRKLLKDYHFSSEAEALAYHKNPIDNLAPLAKARIPIFLLCADADEVVPFEENGRLVYERYRKLGGPVTLVVKHGLGHHPHGLDDPTPMVDFILQATGQAKAAGAPKPRNG
jgi:pimeloyl-ACP methyl ester carboxylesterase